MKLPVCPQVSLSIGLIVHKSVCPLASLSPGQLAFKQLFCWSACLYAGAPNCVCAGVPKGTPGDQYTNSSACFEACAHIDWSFFF